MQTEDQIAARLARYAVTHDARDLWPEVSVAAFRACQQEIARVGAAVLAEPVGAVTLALPAGTDARALGVAAMAAGMGPLLGHWIEAGQMRTEPALAALLALHLEHGRRRAVRMRGELERVLVPLGQHGVEVVVLKGLDTGYRYFPEPGTRPAADIDLFVRPLDLAVAEQVLSDLGFELEDGGPVERGHWIPRDRGSVRSLEFAHADDPWHVDLHNSLDRVVAAGIGACVGPVDLAACGAWSGGTPYARALPSVQLLAHLAIHCSSHFYCATLVRLLEMALVIRREFRGRSDRWQEFCALVQGCRAERFAYPALSLVEKLAPGSVGSELLARLRSATPSRLARLVDALDPGSAQRLHPSPAGSGWMWVGRPREAMVVVANAVWPRGGRGRLPLRKLLQVYRWRVILLWRSLFGVRRPR